ncbi:MAG: hypothetical protein LBN18_05870 [Dysgonamonadaceae bacterium]|jgi:hypothetical protein|nr:hypothetical protein [Dysgonamonadaceae bacterium]
MNTIKNISVIILMIFFSSCSTSDKKVEKFAKGLTEDFINKDSISLYNKQMDGKTAGEWGFLTFLSDIDFSFSSAENFKEMKTPKELVELSEQRYLESKKYEIHLLNNLVNRFNNSFESNIVSVSTDTLFIEQEGIARNLLSKIKKGKEYKVYSVSQIIKTEKGDIIYFRPGFIVSLGNDLYFDKSGLEFSKEKFY